MTMRRLSCTLVAFLALAGAAACVEMQGREAQPSFKGMELYSWRGPDGEWLFGLTPGTNRRKSVEEIQGATTIQGIEELKQALAQLAEGEQVFWSHVGLEGFEYPPAAVLREVQSFAREHEVEVEVPDGWLGPGPLRSLSDLAFMTGCWRGKLAGRDGTVEERYNPAAGGLMLGTSQTIVGGRTVSFEFFKIEQAEGGIAMTPAPQGKPSVSFELASLEDQKAVFENLEHDFPKRIVYQLRDDGSLVARIEGDKPEQSEEFVMAPIPCGAAHLPTSR